jgi:predicted RNA-binding protein with PUA-like domain
MMELPEHIQGIVRVIATSYADASKKSAGSAQLDLFAVRDHIRRLEVARDVADIDTEYELTRWRCAEMGINASLADR